MSESSALIAQSASVGFGIGLRRQHYEALLAAPPDLGWLEIITENYLVDGGKPLHYLDRIRAHYPLAMHGVSLSIGSCDALNIDYLRRVKQLAARIEPLWISDHLCWTGVDAINAHDLLPLPYTEEALRHVVERIGRVQDYLGRRLLLENVSSYIEYRASALTEWEFLREVAEHADCLLLLDVNNIYVSATNHGFDPRLFLHAMPAQRVCQIHLAGHTDRGNYLIDTHDAPIIQPVWDLYAEAIALFGPRATLIERDDNIPELPQLLNELAMARNIVANIDRSTHDTIANANIKKITNENNKKIAREHGANRNEYGANRNEHATANEQCLSPNENRASVNTVDVVVASNDREHNHGAGAAHMQELLEMQRALQTHLLNPDEQYAQAAAAMICANETAASAVRLNIYTNAYRARLLEALSTDFPMLHTYLGDDEFAALVHAYIARYPSHYFSLRDTGSDLAAFLRHTPPYAEHRELCELAEFEWALCYVFDARDAGAATHAEFSALPAERWPTLTLQFIPALRIVPLHSNAAAIWQALNNELAPPASEYIENITPWLLWRCGLKLLFRSLDAAEKLAFEIFAAGAHFSDVCAALTDIMDEAAVPQRAAGYLQQWLHDGIIMQVGAAS